MLYGNRIVREEQRTFSQALWSDTKLPTVFHPSLLPEILFISVRRGMHLCGHKSSLSINIVTSVPLLTFEMIINKL